jgi:hypothetical protein
MIYQLNWGAMNAFCRYLDHDLLGRSFQYPASADDAAEWSKFLDAKVVAPYATFIFSRWARAEQARQFDQALRRKGLGSTSAAPARFVRLSRPRDEPARAHPSAGADCLSSRSCKAGRIATLSRAHLQVYFEARRPRKAGIF